MRVHRIGLFVISSMFALGLSVSAWASSMPGAMLLLLSGGSGQFNDFNGDGSTDLALYNPTTAKWYIQTLGGDHILWDHSFGVSGGVALPADYTGNGITDLAVYHAGSGKWYIQTVQGTTVANGLSAGKSGAIALPLDYNNDGKADLCMYDYTTACWYIKGVDGADLAWSTPVQWGEPSETRSWDNPPSQTVVPVPYDFDEDGRTDFAIYKRGLSMSTSYWNIRYSSGGSVQYTWGSSGSIPVPGKYRDRVGTDPCGVAVYKITTAENNIPYMNAFFLGTYKQTLPVAAGDYDNSGWDDNAVYNYETGLWSFIFNDQGNGNAEARRTAEVSMYISGAKPANMYSAILEQSGYTLVPW
ncbi:MAG: VCBS repeat-containing protein [Spartobacteria bacterium]|nr:VCBS repeat-containing protein [Spartobacteria bacterium]